MPQNEMIIKFQLEKIHCALFLEWDVDKLEAILDPWFS